MRFLSRRKFSDGAILAVKKISAPMVVENKDCPFFAEESTISGAGRGNLIARSKSPKTKGSVSPTNLF